MGVLVLLGVVGTGLALGLSASSPEPATAGGTEAVEVDGAGEDPGTGTKTGGPTAAVGESASPDASSTPSTADAARCWDGTSAASPGACATAPDGSRRGFTWVFPEVDLARCTSEPVPGRQIYSCDVDGTKVNLSRWSSLDAARAHYDSNMGVASQPARGGRVLWRGVGAVHDGQYKSATMYADHPWSLTVYASTEQQRDTAVGRLAMRPAAELRGTVRR